MAAVWSHVNTPSEALVLPRGAYKWRVPAYEVAEIVSELRTRGVRYEAARQMLPHRLAHAILLQMEQAGDSPDDRVQDAVARSAVVKRYAGHVWPALEPKAVLFRLLSDAAALEQHAAGLLTDKERSMQLRAVGRRCSTGSATVLGDLAQGTTPWATASPIRSTRPLANLARSASS